MLGARLGVSLLMSAVEVPFPKLLASSPVVAAVNVLENSVAEAA